MRRNQFNFGHVEFEMFSGNLSSDIWGWGVVWPCYNIMSPQHRSDE